VSAVALPRRLARVAGAPLVILYVACGLLWLAAGLAFPGFASPGHLRYMLEQSALLGIVAAGQTLVVITAGVDLSVGAMIAFAAIFGPSITQAVGDNGYVSIVLLLTLACGIGAINGAAIAWLGIHPMILTLASATILTGVMLLISGGTAVAVQSPVVIWLAQGHVYGVSISILVWLVVAAAVTFLLRGATLGLWLYAIGTSPRASELSGVNEKLALVVVYAVSSGLAGLAGVMLSGVTMQGYIGIGDPYLLLSIAAVVVGGTSILGGHGGYGGTIAGAILLTTVTSLITVVNVSAGWRSVMLGLLVLGLLALYAREGRRA
jgi:ribose transport system permease protein